MTGVHALAKAVLALEAEWPDDDDIDPDQRMVAGIAGLLLCSLAGSLTSREHRANLVDELTRLTAPEATG